MRISALLIPLVAVGCGGGGGTNTDGNQQHDGPPNVPAMITVSGTVTKQMQGGSMPLPGVTVAAYKNSDESTPVVMATSDASGNYSLVITTNGQAVDGFVKGTLTGYTDTYLYPPAPLVANFAMASVNMLDTGTFGTLSTLGGQQAGKGLIVLEVFDASMMPVAGATVSSSPAASKIAYSDSNGLPLNGPPTGADGRAFLFNLPAGQVTVSAMKTGSTFKSHGLNAHADAFTTTIVQP